MGACCSSVNKVIIQNKSNIFDSSIQTIKQKHFMTPGAKNKSHRGSIYAINNENIVLAYNFEEHLGTGYYGTVKIGTPTSDTKKRYAIKSINKSKLNQEQVNQLSREIEILTTVDHPNIIKYYETFNDVNYFHIVMEYCTGGELLERIISKRFFSEYETAEVIYKVSSAISHCHSLGIVHRDLKPENILYESKSDFSDLRIIDFGLSKKIEGTLSSLVGSPYYVAPEVLEGKYNEKCDCWSIGVIMYVLLSGMPPFYSTDKPELYKKIKTQEPDFSHIKWNKVSKEAKSLIRSLLNKNPDKRPSSEAILKSAWISAFMNGKYKMEEFDREVLVNLKSFHFKSQFSKSILKFVVKNMTSLNIDKLKHHFNILDKDKTGFINVDQLKQAFTYCEVDIGNEEIYNLFKNKIDLKGDKQKLNYTSFIAAALDEKELLNRDVLWETFKHFDTKGIGYITVDDFKLSLDRSCKTRSREYIAKMFNEVGIRPEEHITFEMFCKILEREIEIKE
jgi:calcium-dependent protein kinase